MPWLSLLLHFAHGQTPLPIIKNKDLYQLVQRVDPGDCFGGRTVNVEELPEMFLSTRIRFI